MNMYAIKEKTLRTFLKKTITFDALEFFKDYSGDFNDECEMALEGYLGNNLELDEAVDIKLKDFTLLENFELNNSL